MVEQVVNLYVIKDIVADDIGPVFSAKNDGVAVRQYRAVVKSVTNPAEYELYCIGNVSQTMELKPDLRLLNTGNFSKDPEWRKFIRMEDGDNE